MAGSNFIDPEKRNKIEEYLKKLSKKKYSEDDIKNAEKKAESSYKTRLSHS